MIRFLHIFLILIFTFGGNISAQKKGTAARKKIEIVNTSPENGAENVSTTPFLTVEFNQKISKGKGNIYIYNSYDELMAEIDIDQKNIEIDNNELIIHLDTELATDESYHIEIDKNAIAGYKGGYFSGIASDKKWHFKTYASNNGENNLFEKTTPSFYPNPARSTIHLTGQKNVQEVQIINLTGKLVLKDKSKNSSININSLPRGMYIISFLQNRGNRISKKLIKK